MMDGGANGGKNWILAACTLLYPPQSQVTAAADSQSQPTLDTF